MPGARLERFTGILLLKLPWAFLWLLVFLAFGFLLGDSAPWALASIMHLPALVKWLGG